MKFLFLLLLSFSVSAQSPWYFGSGEAVNLTNGIAYNNGVKVLTGALDPSSTAVSAPSGSLYISSSGTTYVKQDAGLSTNWLPFGIAAVGALATINGQSGPAITIAAGSSGTDFAINSAANTITLNLPSSSASNRGLLTSADYSSFLAKQDAITGGATTILSANLTANRALISNGSGKVAVSAVTDTELGYVSGVTSAIQTQIDGKEPSITVGTTADYWRGDKTFQPLDKAAVGLGNVDNTSDANKPISTATQTALDTKITGPASSVDGEVALFDSTTGKLAKRATGTGYAKLTSGVLSASASVPVADITGVLPMANGGTDKALTPVLGGTVYTDAGSMEVLSPGTSGQVLQTNGASAPSWVDKSISGKEQNGSSVTLKEIQVPNNQLTFISTGKYLNESGNQNLLVDPSLEGANNANVWLFNGGTLTIDNTPIHGIYNGQVDVTASSMEMTQSTTLYQTQYADGVQGLASMRVRVPSSITTPIYVCSIQAGTVAAVGSGCVQVQANGKWGLYKVPFILGGTSNGIALTSKAVTYTGSIEWDDAFVGAVDLKQDVDQSRIAGESYFAGTTGCAPTTTSSTIASLTADADCPGPTVVIGDMGSWQTTDANLFKQTINNLPAGKYKAKFVVSAYPGSSVNTSLSITDGTTTCEPMFGNTFTGPLPSVVECTFSYTSSGNRNFELVGAVTGGGTLTVNNGLTSPRSSAKFILEYFGSGSVYSSINADTDWAACNFSTLAWQGLGTVTNNLVCKRQGSDLLIRGRFTAGTTTGSTVQVLLPTWNGSQLTTKSNISSVENTGRIVRNSAGAGAAKDFTVLLSPSVSYAQVGVVETSLASSAFTPVTGTSLVASSEVLAIEARIPINGWENSNVIIGSFNEVMTTPGVTKPKTCYYAFGGASATLAAPTECTTGTCVEVYDSCGTGTPPVWNTTAIYSAMTFASGTFANSSPVTCECRSWDVTSGGDRECQFYFITGQNTWASSVSGGYVANIISYGAGSTSQQTSYTQIKCEGQAP